MTVIRLLVAEDNDFVRRALVDFLTAGGDVVVVAECADGDEVEEAWERTRPDVVMLDLAMQRLGGLETCGRLMARDPAARVVFLTGRQTTAAVREARRLGAVGFLSKAERPERLMEHLRTVASGGTAWFDGVESDAS